MIVLKMPVPTDLFAYNEGKIQCVGIQLLRQVLSIIFTMPASSNAYPNIKVSSSFFRIREIWCYAFCTYLSLASLQSRASSKEISLDGHF